MRAWTLLLGGLAVWAAHFVALYAIASALPGRPFAAWLALAATVPALAADVWILLRARARPGAGDEIDAWVRHVAAMGATLSLLAVLWQASPALLI